MILTILSFSVVLALYLYFLNDKYHNYWNSKKVFYTKPTYFFGNLKDVAFGKKSIFDLLSEIYHSNTDARYVGMYQFFRPVLLIRDLDLIKQITIKDFKFFPNNDLTISKDTDPYFANSLVGKTVDDGWRQSRAKVSLAFSSQKLQIMLSLIKERTQILIKFLGSEQELIVLEMKDTFVKLSHDIMARVVFGISVNSNENPDNIYINLGKECTNFSGWRSLLFYGYSCFPTLMKFFRIRLFKKNLGDFFAKIVKDTITNGKDKNISQNFIQLLTQGTDTTISDEEIIGHCISFYLGGFETVSSFLTFAVYELVINPDVQNKLYCEITEKPDGKLTYDVICSMTYLDAFINEVFRLHSPAFLAARRCTAPYTIEPKLPWEVPIHMDSDVSIWIPLREIHRDPKYFTNPETFDPERFCSENASKISHTAYFPFGIGPRHCVGQRYTLLKVKAIMIELLKNYEFVCVEKTEVPVSFKYDNFFLVPKNGLWVGLKPRIKTY